MQPAKQPDFIGIQKQQYKVVGIYGIVPVVVLQTFSVCQNDGGLHHGSSVPSRLKVVTADPQHLKHEKHETDGQKKTACSSFLSLLLSRFRRHTAKAAHENQAHRKHQQPRRLFYAFVMVLNRSGRQAQNQNQHHRRSINAVQHTIQKSLAP